GHHLPRYLRALLGPGTPRLRPAPGRGHVRRRGAAHAHGAFRVANRPALDRYPAWHRAASGKRLIGLSLSSRGALLRWSHRSGGYVLDVLLLVRRVPIPNGRCPESAVSLREDAWLRESPGTVRRGTGPAGAAPRQLPAGLHAPCADQRRLRSRPAALSRRPRRVSGALRIARGRPSGPGAVRSGREGSGPCPPPSRGR